MSNSLDSILETLNQRSPSGIADFLYEQGIRGRMEHARTCPVAEWVKKEMGVPTHLDIVTAYPAAGVYVQNMDYGVYDILSEYAETPYNVAEFMCRFDRGGYPELIKKEEA